MVGESSGVACCRRRRKGPDAGDVVGVQAAAAAVAVDPVVHQRVAQEAVRLARILARMPHPEGVAELVREELLGGGGGMGNALEVAVDAVVGHEVAALDPDERTAVERARDVGVVPGAADRERAAGSAVERPFDLVVRIREEDGVGPDVRREAAGRRRGAAVDVPDRGPGRAGPDVERPVELLEAAARETGLTILVRVERDAAARVEIEPAQVHVALGHQGVAVVEDLDLRRVDADEVVGGEDRAPGRASSPLAKRRKSRTRRSSAAASGSAPGFSRTSLRSR